MPGEPAARLGTRWTAALGQEQSLVIAKLVGLLIYSGEVDLRKATVRPGDVNRVNVH